MNLRLGLYDLAARHRLGGAAVAELQRLAGFDAEPARLPVWLLRAIGAIGALLTGLGAVFWVAANWDALGRFGQFALLGAVVVGACAGAAAWPAARGALGLLALLATGALLAYFGQTYQTGADTWQLFALWAALALPLAVGARSDLVWTPWVLVAVSAVSLWTHAHTAHRWRFATQDLAVHALAWAAAVMLVATLGPALRRWTGAGAWSQRTGLVLAAVLVAGSAIGALLGARIAAHYPLAVALVVAGMVAFATRRGFDLFGLALLALAFDTLLVAGLARWLLRADVGGEPVLKLLLLGVAAAALLAASVGVVMRIARARAPGVQP